MLSFQHPAGITTLHRLQTSAGPPDPGEMHRLAAARPVTLVLPCHARDLDTVSLAGMVSQLAGLPWISRFIIGLDGLEKEGLDGARANFTELGDRARFLWTGSPAVREIETRLADAGETTASEGKGRNVWLCLGAALPREAESGKNGIIAVHDCDIRDYQPELPARLCLPLLHPDFGFRFVKGYYPRHSDRLHGRLMRLLVKPLLQAMELRAGPMPALQFLSAFRYPLAGETAMDMALAARLTLPATWGLEIGLLDEIRRMVPPSAVCQSRLCAVYDHKHQELSPDNPACGLHRMAREVASTLLGTVSGGTFPWREQILETWTDQAAGALRQAEAESFLNGLLYDPDQEQLAVRTFGRALDSAISLPVPPGLLPSWNRAERACPGIASARAAGLLET